MSRVNKFFVPGESAWCLDWRRCKVYAVQVITMRIKDCAAKVYFGDGAAKHVSLGCLFKLEDKAQAITEMNGGIK